ncbi:MAG: helix-turn-helix domain-containing protein [Kangiellaceae bacterium]|nr:helix-turn-helix domain-containing protein [Kangiellaceae bacterium]MCW8998844.1 helix-turn-helix domain-containing protein [Kangiellaceae bacterium]MCW9017992.1 helix-turn-helix domain-containing protein [Kangiellaceae bacterium]
MTNSLKTIGRVSKQTGVNIETIRYYEKIGLIDEPLRSEGGNRLYDQNNIRRLNFIKRSRELGFSLEEIRVLLQLSNNNREDCHSAQKIADSHLAVVEAKIKDLKQLATVLSNLSAQCNSSKDEGCPILRSLDGD